MSAARGRRDLTGTRTATVALLVTGALTAVLVAWFSAGWRAAHRDRDALEAKARAAAEAAAADDAAAVITRLEDLRAAESQRPYFHYQNLFHDPRGASEGRSVVPSPLAGGPLDPLIAIHFQFDGKGTITAPTVNEEVPDSPSKHDALDRTLLSGLEAARTELVSPGDPIQIAMATPAPVKGDSNVQGSMKAPRQVADDDDGAVGAVGAVGEGADVLAQLDSTDASDASDVSEKKAKSIPYAKKPMPPRAPEPKQQVVALDPDVYAQNVSSNQIFVESRQRQAAEPQQAPQQAPMQAPMQAIDQADQQRQQEPQTEGSLGNGPGVAVQQEEAPPPRAQPPHRAAARPRVVKPPAPPPGPVLITVNPLAWRAATVKGEPALVAVRQVTTPDGVLTQGLMIDRAQVAGWLADRGGPAATISTSSVPGPSAPIGLGGVHWWVAVDAADALRAAAAAGAGLERAFLGRFIPVAALAALSAMLVVLLTARAERLARQRARFAAAAAHELRTPLAGIQLYGDMLVDGLGDPKRHRDYARRVAEEASRLGRVVANVLGFSQLERGSLAVRPEPADLSAAVQAIVERAEPGLLRAGATVLLDAPPGLRARFDADALARIVGNLLDNAEKYTREHADRAIAVTVREAGDHAEIVVVDHGPGLPASLRRRRFRPFARGTGDDGPPGLGLGLALSQNLATAMGGSLTWRDQAEGAAFVVSVPMAHV
ncbi:MAG TPA: HAMP domain-containing sensor histidine kinase [Kofleriaceae bacterium]|nr:HAMP domain-containing sensor histidine kinase [Kofleriaceae bacterium]